MIIFGTRGVTWKGETGEFACAGCGGTRQTYIRKTVRRFFTLYFIPLIPLDKLGEYIECQRCGGTYKDQVLEFDPVDQRAKARDEFVHHVKRVMNLTALADGRIDDAEAAAIRRILGDLSGGSLTAEELEREINLARRSKSNPVDYSRRFAASLDAHGRELVIKAFLAVASAGGELVGEDHTLLNELAEVLNLSRAHLRGILAEVSEQAADGG